jgi:hypothetical protein
MPLEFALQIQGITGRKHTHFPRKIKEFSFIAILSSISTIGIIPPIIARIAEQLQNNP